MKHLANKNHETEAIREALELKAVPAAVDRRLRQVYAELPDEVPTKRRAPLSFLKKTACAVSGLAAAFLLLIGVNSIDPAFAESLPLVGGIFQRVGNPQGWRNLDITQQSVQEYSQTLEGVEVQVPAGGIGEKPMTVSAEEAYYDGEFVYVGLEMDIGGGYHSLHNSWDGYGLLLNGESQSSYNPEIHDVEYVFDCEEMGDPSWVEGEDGRYVSQRAFRVPEKFRGRDSLEVTLQYGAVYTPGNLWGDITLNSSGFALSFPVTKNNAPVKTVDGGGLEMGGVRLVSAVATPAGTAFTVDIPDSYNNPNHGAGFEGGGVIGATGARSPQMPLGDGTTRVVDLQGGFREGETRRAVYSVFDKNDTDEFVAVFLLDFETGTAELGSAEDIPTFTGAMYKCSLEELESFTGDHKVTLASWKDGGNELLVFVATRDESPRMARLEVWQDGVLLGSRICEQDEKQFQDGMLFGQDTGMNQYTVGVLGMEVLDPNKEVTLKLYDERAGELMVEETVTLTKEEN